MIKIHKVTYMLGNQVAEGFVLIDSFTEEESSLYSKIREIASVKYSIKPYAVYVGEEINLSKIKISDLTVQEFIYLVNSLR